jgi:hypothetical protein
LLLPRNRHLICSHSHAQLQDHCLAVCQTKAQNPFPEPDRLCSGSSKFIRLVNLIAIFEGFHNFRSVLQVCLGKSTQEALLGGVYLPDLLQFCLKSYRLAAANCEITQVS